jgi:hypothetical protein
MINEATWRNSAEDQEAIRLAKARLVRVCRMDAPTAERALACAAAEQRAPVVAVAMRILAASAQDLAAGDVLETGRYRVVTRANHHGEARRPNRAMQHDNARGPVRGQRRKGR